VLLQTILGKLYVISLFVTLYVVLQVQIMSSVLLIRYVQNREARAGLADVASNLTHFPTLTTTNRIERTWTPRDESGQTDPTEGSPVPVHVRRLTF